MKFELLFIFITFFFAANTYYDGKYVNILKSFKKYYKIIFIVFTGLSTYLFLKKNPNESKSILESAFGIIKHMPIDKESNDLISPLLDIFDKKENFLFHQKKKLLNSGKNNNCKRSVSETKKKFVASQQDWKCNSCNDQLQAWFEVDHKTRLDSGGSNHINNLVALCRNCHGKKTSLENMNM